MRQKIIDLILMLGILSLLIVSTFINDQFIRVNYYNYNDELRLIDHLLAGICIPLILYLSIGKFYNKCVFYFTWCTYWEIYQCTQRGYFQLNQYTFDLIGIGLAIYLYKHNFEIRHKQN